MENVKPIKPSNLDQYQMDNATFDVEKGAWRVSVVDGITLNVDNIQFPEQASSGFIQEIKVPEIIKQAEIHQINVPVIVKEYEKVEVPVVIKEVEYKEIPVPVLVPDLKVIEIEKPIIVKEIEYKEMPLFFKMCMFLQALGTIGILIIHILKG